jgi:hypothetical protein
MLKHKSVHDVRGYVTGGDDVPIRAPNHERNMGVGVVDEGHA